MLALAMLLALGPAARGGAQDLVRPGPAAATYALLVGSNPGGPGQATLRFAEQDAQRMAQVLQEVGRIPAAQVSVLRAPTRPQLLAALGSLRQALSAHEARGEQAQLVFYFSGHARADGIRLANEELGLPELRERLVALPARLTLIILDACQSGAFSRVKGAEPAAEFSHNSVTRLQTEGVAVMASSTATELSQESEALRGSYFTHHLSVGLRGAGDGDRDGVVSLAEAYRYAYDATLSSTARTAVGSQHVTLETSLKGHGEVPLSYPADAKAQLELPAELSADVLVEHGKSVVAELRKAKGAALRLALPAGAYLLVLREGERLSQCPLTLRDGEVAVVSRHACAALSPSEARAKGYFASGGGEAPRQPQEEWSLELGLGAGEQRRDAYTSRLQDFGFYERLFDGGGTALRLQVGVARQLARHLSVVGELRTLDDQVWERDLLSTSEEERKERFEWQAYALSASLRGHFDLWGDAVRLYAQAGLGAGYAHSDLVSHDEGDAGPVLAGALGASWTPWRDFGFTLSSSYVFAPLLGNEIGDTHDSGGLQVLLGIRVRTWSTP